MLASGIRIVICLVIMKDVALAVKIGIVIDEKSESTTSAVNILMPHLLSGELCKNCSITQIVFIRVNSHSLAGIYKSLCSAVKSQVSVIIGPRNTILSTMVASICEEMKVPNIRLSWSVKHWKKQIMSTVYNVYPSIDEQGLLNQLVVSWEWDYFLFLYSHEEAPLQILQNLERSKKPRALFQVVNTSERGLMETALALRQICDMRICWRDVNRVIVALKPEHVIGLMNAALKLGMINIHNWFLITSLDDLESEFEQFTHNNMRVSLTTLWGDEFNNGRSESPLLKRLFLEWKSMLSGVHLNAFKEFSLLHDALQLACRLETLDQPRECVAPAAPFRKQNVTVFSGMSGKVSFDEKGDRTSSLLHLWELGFKGLPHITGKWTTDEAGNKELLMNSKNVKGTHDHYINTIRSRNILRITTIEEPPYVIRKELANGQIVYEGFCVDIIKRLASSLKFKYDLRIVKDGRYGERINIVNGSSEWDGMVGEILRGEADMAVAPMTVTAGRLEVIDFTDPFLQLGISMLIRQPKADSSASLTSFLWPLSASTWVYSALAVIVTTLLVAIIALLSPTEDTAEFTTQNSFWYLVCILLRAGSGYNCQSTAVRFISAIWWSFTLVLISQYTANFAAVLTVDRKSMPINSFEELGNQTEYKFGAMHRGSTLSFFKNSRIETFQRLYEIMQSESNISSVLVKNNAAGVKKVLDEKYVYLMESATLDYIVTRNCNLTRVGNVVLGSNGYSIALPKGDIPMFFQVSFYFPAPNGVSKSLDKFWT